MQRTIHSFLMMLVMLSVAPVVLAAKMEITPVMQAALDKQKTAIAQWAADAAISKAVRDQNAKGPIAEMDNAKWKAVRRSDALVAAFQENPAGAFLKKKLDDSQGLFSEAFLSAAQGEKVAFVEKTSFYIHKGKPKFDVPFDTGKSWQGEPEFDESTQTFAVQISVPVVDGGKNIGVLVVGVNLNRLEKISK